MKAWVWKGKSDVYLVWKKEEKEVEKESQGSSHTPVNSQEVCEQDNKVEMENIPLACCSLKESFTQKQNSPATSWADEDHGEFSINALSHCCEITGVTERTESVSP